MRTVADTWPGVSRGSLVKPMGVAGSDACETSRGTGALEKRAYCPSRERRTPPPPPLPRRAPAGLSPVRGTKKGVGSKAASSSRTLGPNGRAEPESLEGPGEAPAAPGLPLRQGGNSRCNREEDIEKVVKGGGETQQSDSENFASASAG
ncbi:hypothetical protein CYMTET_15750 [Cymbomonas tetramitiformis]|uniref:Uncharacterized protein n=1 Tax=Cymbomonas tetramitiformis TaxID=36881 RepID=A0AAE0GDL0_9CHLO|nr:hypothetical protein CYMTET_15750 [Cymbomonas tetramitiformis]